MGNSSGSVMKIRKIGAGQKIRSRVQKTPQTRTMPVSYTHLKARTILEQGAQKASGTAKSGTHKEEEESIEDLLDDVKDAAAYTWVLDPSVQADDINYVTSQELGRASENEVKKQKEMCIRDRPWTVRRTVP